MPRLTAETTSMKMLDLVTSTESRPRGVMSMEFSPYLLSASPPVSELSLHSLSIASDYSPSLHGIGLHASDYSDYYSFFAPEPSSTEPLYPEVIYSSSSSSGSWPHKYCPPKVVMADASDESNASLPSILRRGSRSSSLGPSKRVSFADDSGIALSEVRLMLNNSPPCLTGVQLVDSDDDFLTLAEYKPQPHERPNFHDFLQWNMVAVENITFREEVICTIFADKRPTSKNVFARLSMDNWDSFKDVEATLNPASTRPGYDTYYLRVPLEPTVDRSKPIQFAVCYEADGVQHWDNNDGNNFVLSWKQEKKDDFDFRGTDSQSSDSLSEYGGLVWFSHREIDRPFK